MIVNKTVSIKTKGDCHIIDITAEAEKSIATTELNDGIITMFVAGSTAGITTIEYEPGLVSDFKNMWERIVPENIPYGHDERWGDGNGYSHIRASLLGASLVIPFIDKKLALGTWQQIVLIDFDNRARTRNIVLQIMGE